ncbi:hypothetical protein ACOBQX_05795 [Actinokineospora sp. G85]|uniref:hypothetical protein n=1 Tax=Actinokineospora sp. G85 TaxID=3406626 RepID=UPI003C763D68
MSVTTERAVTADELIARARDLVPLLRANRARTEELGNPAPENLAALSEAELFRLTTPPAFGGLHPTMRTQVEAIAEIGSGCPSTGWIVANHAASTEFTSILDELSVREIFGDNPDAIMLSAGVLPGARADRVPGGLRITATAGYASGCEISDWALLIGIPLHEGERRIGAVTALAPIAEASVKRTWKVAGMCGTGTHSMTVTDLFVPDRMTLVVEKENLDRQEEILSPPTWSRATCTRCRRSSARVRASWTWCGRAWTRASRSPTPTTAAPWTPPRSSSGSPRRRT